MKNQMARSVVSFKILIRFVVAVCLTTTSAGWAAEVHNSAAAKRKINFEDLPKLVSEKNENVEAAKLHMNAQEFRRGRLARSLLPQISAVAGSEQFKLDNVDAKSQEYWRLEASINLYKGGRDQIEDKIRDSVFELSQKSFQGEFRNELKEARKAYWQLVALNQLIEDRKDELKKNEQSLKSARRRSGAGLATNADAAQFELHKIVLEKELIKLELKKDVSQNQLSVALTIDEHASLEVPSVFPKIPYENISKDISSDKLLAVQINKNLEFIEQLKADQASRWWLPKVDLYSSYGLPSLAEEYDRGLQKQKQWSTGLRLTVDLGQGFEDRKESQARHTEATSFKKKVAHAMREGQAQSHDLDHDIRALSAMIKDSDQDVKAAETYLKLTESEYNRGVKNGPDLLEAIKTYYEFREKRIQYYRDFYNTKAEQDSLTTTADNS